VNKIGLVIPTVLSRPTLLPLVYQSCLDQGELLEILVGCPEHLIPEVQAALPPGAKVVAEKEGISLAGKISELMLNTSDDCKYIAWIGDDDIILPGAMQACLQVLESEQDVTLVYGACDYIDESGSILFTNKSGQWASTLLRFGPQLIPQPGSVMRRAAFEKAGGLNSRFNMAFDFDIFLKLEQLGKLRYVPKTLAQFRWHPGSLSVRRRGAAVLEASLARRQSYKYPMSLLWPAWEPVVILATWLAGKFLSFRIGLRKT
jgi:GT2 family glycosyltransferase